MTSHSDRPVSAEKRAPRLQRLKKLNDKGEREAFCTVYIDLTNGAEIVIGARTKKACIEAFNRLWKAEDGSEPLGPMQSRVYRTAFRKVSDESK